MTLSGREARPASARWNVAKTLVQTACFWSFFLFAIPPLVLLVEDAIGLVAWRFDAPLSRAAGVLLFALCGTLGLWSGITMAIVGAGTPVPFDCPRALVVRGPYRMTRNPMVIAGIGQGIAVGLFLGSPLVIAYALCGAVVWNAVVRPWEERDLASRFGSAYETYRRDVPCWRCVMPRSSVPQADSSESPSAAAQDHRTRAR